MQHPSRYWLVALALLTSLAGCAPETPADQPTARPLPPRPAAATAVAPAAGYPAGQATGPRRLVRAPAATAQPAPAAPPRLARRVARLLRRQRVRPAATPAAALLPAGPAPMAGSPAPPAAQVAPAASAPAAPAAETLAASASKPAQNFLIRPDRDTVLYGTEGTVMRIPAGTFVLAESKQKGKSQGAAPAGLVELKLREFYSMADILLERLSTQAGPGKLLETGGMVQLSATAGGQECRLRAGSAFELGFPATRPIDGMQLYDGQATRSHDLSWKLAPQAPAAKTKKARPEARHWRQPHFAGGYGPTRKSLARNVAYAPATALRLNGYQPPQQLRRRLRRAGRRAPIVGKVEASFEISEKGGVSDVFLRNAGQADSALEAAVLQALRRVVADPSRLVYPGLHRRSEATRSLMKVDVRFTADRRVLVDHLRWDRAATLALYNADTERRAMGKAPLTNAQLQAAPLEVLTDALFQKRQNNAKRYSVKSFLGEQLNYVKELAVFRVQVVTTPRSLGWYNCDRPAPPLLARVFASSKSQVRAPTGGLARLALVRLGLEHPAAQPADISLVLRERRCVIRGGASAGRIEFEQLAEGTAATLVAIRREQGQLYLALRDVTVSQHVEPPLAFRPVTVAELKAAVAQLDL